MSSTKKGKDRCFGMKAHIGADAGSGVTHRLETSTAKLHDSQVWDELLHGKETSVGATRATSAPSARRSRLQARPGVSCARHQRAANCIPSMRRSTVSPPSSAPRSSTPSASSNASSAL
ncbi:transposase [Cereibacter johrii]|uniref:transposase n=1 Tax=Cereibacter johrii TaxID=445629 RepID=UPI00399F0586